MLKRKIAYFILLYAVIAFNVIYNFYSGYVTLVVMIVLPVLSAIILVLQKFLVRITISTPTDIVYRFTEYTVYITVTNPTPFPITCGAVKLERQGKEEYIEFGVSAFSKTVFKYRYKEKHCIQTTLSAKKVYIYDYFKIIKLRIKAAGVAKVTVLPGLFGVFGQNIDTGERQEEDSTRPVTKKGDDRTEIYGIRAYTDGDSERNIHWKLSSSQNKLMVKEFGQREEAQLLFTAAFYRVEDEKSHNINDMMLEAMYSVMHSYIEQNIGIWGVVCSDGGDCLKYHINSKQELNNYFISIIAAKEAVVQYSTLFAAFNMERKNCSFFHFSTELTGAEVEAIITANRISDTFVYLPESTYTKAEEYKKMGINLSYIAMGGGVQYEIGNH